MKRISYVLVCILSLILIPIHVFAAGSVSVSTTSISVEQGKSSTFQITAVNAASQLTFSVSDGSVAKVGTVPDWIENETATIKVDGLKVGTTTINIDVNAATFDEEVIVKTYKIKVEVKAPKSSNANLSNIKVDGIDLAKFNSSTTTYTLNNTDASSITIAASAEDSKVKMSGVGEVKLAYGLNTINIVVTAENGSKKTYTLKITRNDSRSSDNSLKSLTVSQGKIDFDSDKTSYNIIVDNNVEEIKVDAKANDSKSKVVGAGAYALKVYINVINIEVSAENGSKKTYTIRVTRKDENGNVGELSSVNTLESLVVEGYDIGFSKDRDVYYLDVAKNVEKVNVIAKRTDSKSMVTIENPEVLSLGDNTIIIDVTAENGATKTYKIIVNRDNDIPKITINELLDTINETESDTIIVNIKDDNNVITKEMLEKLKSTNKKLIINKYLNDEIIYTWEINGSDIKEAINIDTLIEFNNLADKKLDELTDYARYLYFKNNLDTSAFNQVKLKIYTKNEYSDSNIYGYIYDDEELTLKFDDLKYNDTYIELNDLDKGSYVITQKDINSRCIYKIMAIVEFIAIILLIMSIVIFNIMLKKKMVKQ